MRKETVLGLIALALASLNLAIYDAILTQENSYRTEPECRQVQIAKGAYICK